jgi:methylmalonyl-CoA/ethylmalonyl-CoA epimerase
VHSVHEEVNEEQGVREAMLAVGDGDTRIQLLAPLTGAPAKSQAVDLRGRPRLTCAAGPRVPVVTCRLRRLVREDAVVTTDPRTGLPAELFTTIDQVGIAVPDLDEGRPDYPRPSACTPVYEEVNEEQGGGAGTSDSRVNFVHPKDAGGVLVELVRLAADRH